MNCPRCDEQNPAHSRFCLGCGLPLAVVCTSCGARLPEGSRFCNQCGAAVGAASSVGARFAAPDAYTPRHLAEKILVSRATLEGERKQITVVFADVKGSMELLADRDPEEARKILDPVLELLIEAVHHYEGTVNQITGDGIMALFGAPLAHEDHAVRACYAALRMQAVVRRYTHELRQSHGVEVQVRVGLNSGEVVVRAISNDLHLDYSAIGQTTHLAARMEQLASPGTIRLTADTLRLAEDFVQVTPLGAVPVKGLASPVEVFELVGALPIRTRLQASAVRGLTRFVGREHELERLRDALARAGAGHGQIVAVEGEVGVGKSRLFYEFTRSRHTAGWRALEGVSVSYGKATTYFPVIELLKGYFKIHERDDQREIREKVTGKLLTLDPGLQSALPPFLALLDVSVDDLQWQTLDPGQRRHWTLDAVTQVLLRESAVQPLILVFEDLHWIDSETQALLDRLVESLAAARVLLLVNYRPEYRHPWSGAAYYVQLRVDPLSPESAEELLSHLLGDAPGLAALKQALIQRTEANPFFLEETVRMLVESGALAGERGTHRLERAIHEIEIPATVQAVLAGRIDRLPPELKRLLQSAAVVGKDVSYSLLRAIAEVPDDELRAQLDRLHAAEFLYEAGLFPEVEYTFKHSLTHDVAYGTLLRERREALHARLVEVIETLYADRLGEYVERLAHHAVNGRRWDKALLYLRQAGARAFARSAQKTAAALFEQALGVLERLPKDRHMIEQAIDLRLELRYALIPLGEFPRVLRCLEEAERLAGSLGDQRRLGLIYSFLTNYFQVSGDPERGLDYGRRALAIAETHGDLTVTVIATAFLASACHTLGDYPQAIEFARRNAAALSGELAYQRFGMANLPSVYSRATLVRSLAERGEFGQAVAVGEEALRIAEKAEHPVSLTLAWFAIGYLHLRQGGVNEAIAALERAVELSRVANVIWFRQVASALGSAYAEAGRVVEALRLLEEAAQQAASIGVAGAPLGHGARLLAHGEALLAAGRPDEARELAAQALQFLEAIKARGYQGWTLRLLGMIATRRDPPDLEAGEVWLRRALAIAEELGMHPLGAHCHLAFGALWRRARRLEASRAELSRAAQLFRAGDMKAWAAHAETELTREGDSCH